MYHKLREAISDGEGPHHILDTDFRLGAYRKLLSVRQQWMVSKAFYKLESVNIHIEFNGHT